MTRNSTFFSVFIFLLIIFCIISMLSMALLQGSFCLLSTQKNNGMTVSKLCFNKTPSDNHVVLTPPVAKISTFKTSFTTSGASRSHNVILAASHFRWLKVPSGSSISFNELVGKRTEENGYRTGLVIFNGKYVPGIGGGVCQVSSTLYNAWIRAGLGVVEVKAHSLPTSYCQLAQDATVSDWIDLVLCNDTDNDVVINSSIIERNLIFDIYGEKLKFDIKIISRIIATFPPPLPEVEFVDKFSPDDKIYEGIGGKYAIATNEKNGYSAQSFVQLFDGLLLVEEKLMRTERYIYTRGKILMEKPPIQQVPIAP